MSTKQTLLQNNYTHKTARGVRAILLTPSALATFDDSIATYSTSLTIPWPQYTFHDDSMAIFHYSRITRQLLYSRDTVRQFYCYKVQQFRECLRMILPIPSDNYASELRILRFLKEFSLLPSLSVQNLYNWWYLLSSVLQSNKASPTIKIQGGRHRFTPALTATSLSIGCIGHNYKLSLTFDNFSG